MEKRIIIAAALSVFLIILWGYFNPMAQKGKQTVPPVKPPVKKVLSKSPVQKASEPSPITHVKTGVPSAAPSLTVSKSLVSSQGISYQGDNFLAGFATPGGGIDELRLSKYSYTEKDLKNKVNLANSIKKIKVLDFIPSKNHPLLRLLNITKKSNSIDYTYKAGGNLILEKEYKFSNGKYILSNNIIIKNLSGRPVVFKGNYVFSSRLKPSSNSQNFINLKPVVYLNNKQLTPAIAGTAQYSGNISFAGFDSKYFLFSFLNPGPKISAKKTGNVITFSVPEKVVVDPGKTAKITLDIFAGPKKLSLLNQAGHNLNSTLSFGFFGFFSVFLLHMLEFFYGFVHNYGIAIILLVLVIRIIFYPLTYVGFKSMRQMQKLTPKINEAREKYKDDKAELNRKIMELYKEGRVNPFGGCLPMILQIPVFWALYMTLLVAIQMRNAPFAFWITNLAVQDPYYVLPILMGITMFLSQKMNPTIGDPTQAKIMLVLPLVFTFLFIHFPAGLLLYWTVNNILTIAQQYVINKKFA